MRYSFIALLVLLAHSAMSQQDQFKWRIGAHGGITRSLGDIESSYKDVNWDRSSLLGLELSKSLGYGISLGLGYEYARVSGYDMLTGRKDRALNFMAELNTAQLELTFRSDNGKLLKYDARFAPFITFGAGVGQYDVFGDLYSANGSRYYYWNDGSIRDEAENGINAADASVIKQDGDFETRLTDLATEDGKPKDQYFVFIPARIGLKWRICDRMAAELYYGFNWTFTDGIDDVHDAYPKRTGPNELTYISNPTGRTGQRGDPDTNDKYQSIGLNLAYYFGRRSNSYRMEPIYVDDRSLPTPPPPAPLPLPVPFPMKKLPPLAPPVPTNVVINVERITVGSLSVDTLVVGTLVTRKQAAPDTAAEYSIRKAKLDSILTTQAGLDSTQMDSLRSLKVDSLKRIGPDSILLREVGRDTTRMDSLRSSELDSLQMLAPDSIRSRKTGLVITRMDSLKTVAPDSLRSALRDQTVVPSSDTIRTATMDTLPTKRSDTLVAPPGTSPQRRTLQELEPDSIVPVLQDTVDSVPMDTARVGDFIRGARQHPQDSVAGGKAPVAVHDTVTVYKKQSEGQQGRVDTVYVDRPVPTTRSEPAAPTSTQQPQQVIIRQESSGSKETRTVPIPIPIVIPSNKTKVVQDPALQDSLNRMAASNKKLQHIADSLRGDTSALGVYRRSAVPIDTTPIPPGVRPEDYAFILNDLLAARIATLERYIEVMDDKGSAADTDSLKQRIAAMDGELEKLRSKGKATKDGAATAPGMGQNLMDSISFSSGSSRVGSEERAHLLKMGKQIASGKIERVLVTGQTDRSGDPAFNLQLSQKRADAVKQVLVEAGVPVGIISAKGLGDKLAQHTHNESERVVVVQLVMPAKKAVE